MDNDYPADSPTELPIDDDRVYSRIVTGFAIGIAVLVCVVFASVLI